VNTTIISCEPVTPWSWSVYLSVCVDGQATRGHVQVVRVDGEYYPQMTGRSDPTDSGFSATLVAEWWDQIVAAACQGARDAAPDT
jgi:hypothetical protein